MSLPSINSLPSDLKQVKHYLKIAIEHDQKNPIVAYYCRLYAMQQSIHLVSEKNQEGRTYLIGLMDYLEQFKKQNASNEEVMNEIVGQAHMEDYALKLFNYADNEDRNSRFTKAVVKSYYTASLLFDVLTVFGELSDDIFSNRKYAKWKATYIHKCMQNGETPIPGPIPQPGDEDSGFGAGGGVGFENYNQPNTSYLPPPQAGNYPQDPGPSFNTDPGNTYNEHKPAPAPRSNLGEPTGTKAPPTTPQDPQNGGTIPVQNWIPPQGVVQLKADDYQKGLKYCNYASSALRYEDSPTAIDYLQKALKLLTTGQDS